MDVLVSAQHPKSKRHPLILPMLFEWFSMVPDSESGIVPPSTAWDIFIDIVIYLK